MATGVVPGVLRLGSADELPLPPPPGLVVVASEDPVRTARTLVAALGAEACLTPVDARAEIERRREADLRAPREQARRRRAEAVAATADAEEARALLPPAAARLRPDIVRRAAQSVRAAARALEAARSDLGARPPLDHEAAGAARTAHAELAATRGQRYARLPQANSVLSMANGAAGVLVVGRLASDAFDPAFFLVAVLPLAALGFTAHTVVANVRRCRAAARRRWAALRSLDVSTMQALADLEERAAAWAERKARVVDAESQLARAQTTWRSLAGDVPVSHAARLVSELEALARLDASAQAAQAASTEAAAELQQAEDLAGRGGAPMVVVDTRRSARETTRRRAVEELARSAGTAPVVVVERAAVARRSPISAPPDEGGAVIDVRGRLLAGLQRLRMKPDPRRAHQTPPGSAAASG